MVTKRRRVSIVPTPVQGAATMARYPLNTLELQPYWLPRRLLEGARYYTSITMGFKIAASNAAANSQVLLEASG
jgi:hypothetical protein